jgi:hypothetical protein
MGEEVRMTRRFLALMASLAVATAVLAISSAPVAAQQKPATTPATATKAYKAPRTADGQPDLQGVWANNDATPLERPKELEGRTTLTDAEVAALSARAAKLFNGDADAAFGDEVFLNALRDAKSFSSYDKQVGNYNQFWIVERPINNRTSLITDPADGKVPALTPAAKQQVDAFLAKNKDVSEGVAGNNNSAEGPEDFGLGHRCISFGVPRLGAGYNSYYQIIQSKDWVAIYQETIHDARIIPLDNRPHVSNGVRQLLGDARGHFEGDTLVVETTNFNDVGRFRNLPQTNMKVVERYTRIAPQTLQWSVTINDPTVYAKPWTADIDLHGTKDQIYEYACHEGNEGMPGALAGIRMQEKAAKNSAIKGSN